MSTDNGTVVVARDVTRRYGEGETAVDALRGVSVEVPRGQAHRRDGALGVGQVDADAHPRRPRQADLRLGHDRRQGDHDAQGLRPHEAPARAHRLRVPVLQPAPDAERGGEHPLAARDRGGEARRGVVRRPGQVRRPRRPALAPAGRALGRPAAARRDRPRARLAARRGLRRRADGEPRLAHGPGDPRALAPLGRGPRADDRDGHPRGACRGDRRPRAVPRRRADRARARRARRSTRSTRRWRRSPLDDRVHAQGAPRHGSSAPR